MYIILWLAAGVAAASVATAAPARPGGTGSGHGGNPPGGWSNGGGHHAGQGRATRFGVGAIGGDRGHGRHHRRSGEQDSLPYGAAGIGGPVGMVDRYGNGFFTGGGGQIRLRGGRPYFDYDRAYPYEWASVAGGRQQPVVEERPIERRDRCTTENGVRVCRGW